MRLERRVNEWWFEPTGPKNVQKIPARYKNIDPASGVELPSNATRIAAFAPSRRWEPYNRLEGVDGGYFTELYSLKDIAKRYRLSENSSIYFKKHILPKPFDIVRRRSVSAHHWSRIVLMVMDVVMKDLEKRGVHQFLKRFEDHVDLLHEGTEYLHDFYSRKFEELDTSFEDRLGVQWYER